MPVNLPQIIEEPIPVDARQTRESPDFEVVMKDIEEPRTVIDLTKNISKPTLNSEKKRYGHRHSELSTQIDPKEVVNSILDTQVALPI